MSLHNAQEIKLLSSIFLPTRYFPQCNEEIRKSSDFLLTMSELLSFYCFAMENALQPQTFIYSSDLIVKSGSHEYRNEEKLDGAGNSFTNELFLIIILKLSNLSMNCHTDRISR